LKLSRRKSGKRAGRQNGSDERVIFAVEWAKNRMTTSFLQRNGKELQILQLKESPVEPLFMGFTE
jgi:hypothetical protein